MVAEQKNEAAASIARAKVAKFVPFTDQSLQKIADRIAADNDGQQTTTEAEERSQGKAGKKTAGASAANTRKDKPNTAFVAGKQFPELFGIFPPELYGKPIEDLDEFYRNKYVSIYSIRHWYVWYVWIWYGLVYVKTMKAVDMDIFGEFTRRRSSTKTF